MLPYTPQHWKEIGIMIYDIDFENMEIGGIVGKLTAEKKPAVLALTSPQWDLSEHSFQR